MEILEFVGDLILEVVGGFFFEWLADGRSEKKVVR